MSQLRRAVHPDTILTKGSGYQLASADTDAKEFERLTKLAAEQEADEAIIILERALALWRGRAFQEFENEDWARLEIARLEVKQIVVVAQPARPQSRNRRQRDSCADDPARPA